MLMSRKESRDIYDDGFIFEQQHKKKHTQYGEKRISYNMKDISFLVFFFFEL